ncbi:MAG TPA: SDR family oxidoreductase [Roseiflexaceae bacterium]|nr:SDR family oxidoreductase [Roseiflexaceae bacterium]HMP38944.1 SDR family oxidoreductase [Roseiflexaceae bacterium]
MNRLTDKVALVTGASRGIGRGIAICLAEEGADVVVGYRTHPEEAEETAAAIAALGRRAIIKQVDVARRDEVMALVRAAVDAFGRLDIAVANAAFSIRQPVAEAVWEDVLRTLEVTQHGVFHTCQFAAQQLLAQGGGGKIIIISSVHAEKPVASSAAYNMGKAAINHLGATMASELAAARINVNVINPGWIDTPGERAFYSEEQIQAGGAKMPWGRLGTPRDIGRSVVFLASDDADYITGSVLRVDGGIMVR